MKPRLLDLFCGAGGAAMGYYRAGFNIVGIDIKPQKHYPFPFIQGDALNPPVDLSKFDAIHASPPCQGYSIMRNLPWLKNKEYPLLIEPIQKRLAATGKPWIIENVMGAKLNAGWLCGTMFGLPFYRHRYFWSSFFWLQPSDSAHRNVIKPGRNFGDRGHKMLNSGCGHTRGISALLREAMQIDWMTRDEITQAIPPAYTEFIGKQLLLYLTTTSTVFDKSLTAQL
jgi:DNA (cytosine-5)-methyltransferase 1